MADVLELDSLVPGSYEGPAASGGVEGEACLVGKAPITPRGDCGCGSVPIFGECDPGGVPIF